MAVYADHPFKLIPTPVAQKGKDAEHDQYDDAASEMALVHNMMIRGLNAGYLQAPYVEAADAKNFCTFLALLCKLMRLHHRGEEEMFFPEIERLTGEVGIMDKNLEQHHAFEPGLEAFETYVNAVVAGTQPFDSKKIVDSLDSWGHILVEHLSDEIPTLVDLRRYSEKLGDVKKRFDKEGEEVMKKLGLKCLTLCFSVLDVHYEDDIWSAFPPAPAIVQFLCRRIIWFFNSGVFKYGACDQQGRMKPLYAVPADAKKAV